MQKLGVLLVAIFLIFYGFMSILLGVAMIFAKEEIYGMMKEEFENVLKKLNATHLVSEEIFSSVYETVCFTTIAIGTLYLISAIGVFALKNWARNLAILLLVFQLAYSLATIHVEPLSILGVVFSIVLLWYLFRKDVKEMFSGKKTTIEERILGRKI